MKLSEQTNDFEMKINESNKDSFLSIIGQLFIVLHHKVI